MARLRYGRYETMGLIASGGMASVHLGRACGPAGFERLVAIKVMHEHIASDPEFSAMFLDEARLAAQIRHPNVVPTLDVSEDGRIIVMEYVEGASLAAVLRHMGNHGERLPLPTALRIVLDVLDGLEAAHELRGRDGALVRLVHRDISPHNVLVGVDGISRITDFGIAFAQSRLTSTRGATLKGKLPYMAPEQLEGREVDRQVDVYAAGVVLWELLVGARLFVADSDAALACRVLAGPSQSPRDRDGSIPQAIDRACMKALARREERYPTALAFAEALEASAAASAVQVARPRSVAEIARAAQVAVTPPSSHPVYVGDGPRAETREPSAAAEPVHAPPTTKPLGAGDPQPPAAEPGPAPSLETRRLSSDDAQPLPAARAVPGPLAASGVTPVLGSARGALRPSATLRSEDGEARAAIVGAARPPAEPDLVAASRPSHEQSAAGSSLRASIPGLRRQPGVALVVSAGAFLGLGALAGWLLLRSAEPSGTDDASAGRSTYEDRATAAPRLASDAPSATGREATGDAAPGPQADAGAPATTTAPAAFPSARATGAAPPAASPTTPHASQTAGAAEPTAAATAASSVFHPPSL